MQVIAAIDEHEDGLTVRTFWSGVPLDRPQGMGWGLKATPAHRNLAARLVAAVNAGVVFRDPVVKTDVNGRTYASASCQVFGRHMNADLRKLGF